MNLAESSESNSESEPGGSSLSPVDQPPAAGFGRGKFMLLAIAFLGVLACSGAGVWLLRGNLPPISEEHLTSAEQRWEQNAPASYDLQIELGGNSPGMFVVEVRQGRVQTAPTRNGIPVRSRAAWETWTVPGQFETIRRELELAADPEREMNAAAGERLVLRGEFDPIYGYPRRYHRIALGGGPEVEWVVKRFEPKE